MSPFDFDDYRSFIKSAAKELNPQGRGQYSKIAKHLNVHSSLVSQIMMGTKDFTPEQLFDLCEYFKLNEPETDYLILLLERERVGTLRLKQRIQRKIEKAKNDSRFFSSRLKDARQLTSDEALTFYSSWIYSAIRLSSSINDGSTPEWIQKRFRLSKERTQEILEFLLKTQLLRTEGSKLTLGPQVTHLPEASPLLQKHHTNWRLKAIEASENRDPKNLIFTAPLSISDSDFDKMKSELVQMLKRFEKRVADSPAEKLACLNIDFFSVD